MEKVKNILLVFILLFGVQLLISKTEAKAETIFTGEIYVGELIDHVFIKKEYGNGYWQYKQGRFLRRSPDNYFVYCLEPFVEVDNTQTYYVYDSLYYQHLNISYDTWEKVSLLAYYGYNYKDDNYDHTDAKWYAITQVLIWREMDPETEIYFTNTLNGERDDNLFQQEIRELENLVLNYYAFPIFNYDTLISGDTATLIDETNVLSQWEIDTVTNGTAFINGNTLVLSVEFTEPVSILFKRKQKPDKDNILLYLSDTSQNILVDGNLVPLYNTFESPVFGGSVTLNKKNKATNSALPIGEATLSGAMYGIYSVKDDTLVDAIVTDINGVAQSDSKLPIGEYYLKEITPPLGYQLSEEISYFSITKDNLHPTVTVFDSLIPITIDITKYIDVNGSLKPEENVQFALLDKFDQPISTTMTDINGNATVTVPYDTAYTLHQITSTPNYLKSEDIQIFPNIRKVSYSFVIVNKELEAKVKVQKIDKETQQVIAVSGVKFQILDENSQPICQDITYPFEEKICIFETSDDGTFITPLTLKPGTYKLIELADGIPFGYQHNSTPLVFRIDDSSTYTQTDDGTLLLTLNFANERQKGTLVIEKNGENLVLDNNSFHYEDIPLDDVTFEIYAKEDIIICGILFYAKDELVTTLTTKNGMAVTTLELGNYYILETKNDNHHILLSSPIDFTLYDTSSKKITIKNYLPKGTLTLTKIDSVTKEPLVHTEFEIYTDENVLIYSGFTDEIGKIVIDSLFKGTFFIKEITPTHGYQMNEEITTFTISEDDEVVQITLENDVLLIDPSPDIPIDEDIGEVLGVTTDFIIPDVPYTGIHDLTFFYISLILSSISLLFITIKKRSW
ncbi:MAG: Cys-Gln thioester bond-forming surface protein [Bacilli bacterium]|nr:Cys-Gln thioester bond-forming surface protein [Bacilli bacterium]